MHPTLALSPDHASTFFRFWCMCGSDAKTRSTIFLITVSRFLETAESSSVSCWEVEESMVDWEEDVCEVCCSMSVPLAILSGARGVPAGARRCCSD